MKKRWSEDNYLLRFEENKDHLIDRLDLTDEQKAILKNFFKKYPNYESKIDWNNKNLRYEDFESLLANEGKSKSQAKKKGLEGITEGIDYRILDQKPDYVAYQPLTYLGSVTIASNRVPPVKENGAQWCTAYQKTSKYWNNYTRGGVKFCYVCDSETKYALVQYPEKENFERECYSFYDQKITCPEKYAYLYDILLDEMKRKIEKRKEDTKNYLPILYKRWIKTGVASIPLSNKYREYITEITIPNSVTSIGKEAFAYCTSLRSITIPGSVASIGISAFYECGNLKNITIPDSVTSISDSAFFGCSSLESITIPDSVTSIGNKAFRDCNNLTNITIPDSVTSIGKEAFHDCTNLENITIPNSVTSIGGDAFEGCKSLTSITIPDSVTSINAGVFKWCESLQSITIPNSVTSIGTSAFTGCKSLTSITIPNSVTSIGLGVFRTGRDLTIYYQGTEEQWQRIAGSEMIDQPVVFKEDNID